jgi:hypothetical protein
VSHTLVDSRKILPYQAHQSLAWVGVREQPLCVKSVSLQPHHVRFLLLHDSLLFLFISHHHLFLFFFCFWRLLQLALLRIFLTDYRLPSHCFMLLVFKNLFGHCHQTHIPLIPRLVVGRKNQRIPS